MRSALREAATGTPASARPAMRRPRLWLIGYSLLFVVLVAAYPLIGTGVFGLPREWAEVARRLALVALVLLLARTVVAALELGLHQHGMDAVTRYNLLKVVNLLGSVAVLFSAATQLFSEWYTAVASLGVASLILGLALQAPLTSFFAWIYILIRQPYRVGDRIRIGEATGDVINVGYLDTTLWEFGGPYLSSDHPSGRIIKFPNSLVVKTAVFNYTWPMFPYVWNEVKFQIGFDSDLEFVARTMQQVVEEELGEVMMARVATYRRLLAKTPVDELTVQERPQVVFRTGDTWIEAIVRYVVNPKETGRVKSSLIRKLVPRLNAHPELVRFPRGNSR